MLSTPRTDARPSAFPRYPPAGADDPRGAAPAAGAHCIELTRGIRAPSPEADAVAARRGSVERVAVESVFEVLRLLVATDVVVTASLTRRSARQDWAGSLRQARCAGGLACVDGDAGGVRWHEDHPALGAWIERSCSARGLVQTLHLRSSPRGEHLRLGCRATADHGQPWAWRRAIESVVGHPCGCAC